MNNENLNNDDSLEFEAMHKAPSATEQLQLDLLAIATVSGKVRYLTALGWKRGPIAKHLGIRYQHVRNVQVNQPKRTELK